MSRDAPFIGPRPFTESDAEIFFGRATDLASLIAEVLSTQVLLLYAPSGSGKSSLLNAGLTPAVRKEGFTVSQVRLNTLVSGESQQPSDALNARVVKSTRDSSPEQPSLLVLDQFEEILIALTSDELRALADTVYEATGANPLARIVISFREEYLARVSALFNRPTAAAVGHYHLDRLSKGAAREAFECTLSSAGFQVDGDAADMFLDRLAPSVDRWAPEARVEPLYLQLLGSQLWASIASRRAPGDGAPGLVVTVADVDGLVDLDQAIEVFYNSTIGRVCAKSHVTEKAVRDWIDQYLVTPDETRSMVRRQLGVTNGVPTSVIDELVTDGLLRTEPRGDDLWLELAHDQLVERVRDFNRTWWSGLVYTRLVERSERFQLAQDASRMDLQRWMTSRTTLWTYANTLRETGIQFSRRYRRWVPFMRAAPMDELDRLALRAVVLTGTMINSGVTFYRSTTWVDRPTSLRGLESLDAETARRRLRATGLNLGRVEQVLALANVCATFSWTRLLSRILTDVAVHRSLSQRRRGWYVALLCGADGALTLLRWAVRYGLIENCLDPAGAGIQRPRGTGGHGVAPVVRRCRRLEDVAAWSSGRPVLLVLDWRPWIKGDEEFDFFARHEVPAYAPALQARGALVAWCCRADLPRRSRRSGLSGVGLMGLGQRTYYVVEGGHVVAWRTVKSNERAVPARTDAVEAGGDSSATQRLTAAAQQRFVGLVSSLVERGEAVPPVWREWTRQYFDAVFRTRGGSRAAAEGERRGAGAPPGGVTDSSSRA